MIGILVDNMTAEEIASKIKDVKSLLLENGLLFGDFFPVILTDNGGEFADIFSIENSLDEKQETRLFFCDPHSPSQKPHCEKNHTLFRDIVPKGKFFDDFSQKTVDLIFSHINSTARKSLFGKSPYELFTATAGKAIAIRIEPKQNFYIDCTNKLPKFNMRSTF